MLSAKEFREQKRKSNGILQTKAPSTRVHTSPKECGYRLPLLTSSLARLTSGTAMATRPIHHQGPECTCTRVQRPQGRQARGARDVGGMCRCRPHLEADARLAPVADLRAHGARVSPPPSHLQHRRQAGRSSAEST